MKIRRSIFLLGFSAFFLFACTSSEFQTAGRSRPQELSPSAGVGGAVPRATYQINYSALLLDFYRKDPRMHQAATGTPPAIRAPARIAVAQLGELQAAPTFLAELRKHSDLLANVASIPAVPPDLAGFYDYTEQSVSLGGTEKRTAPKPDGKDALTPNDFLQQLRLLSLDMGSDYLLVYGGSIDFRTKADGLAKLLDLTIIGAFVVPSEAHSLQGRAIGLLIDVRENRIVMSVASDGSRHDLASTRYSESALRDLVTDVRLELQKNLAQDFVQTFTGRVIQLLNPQVTRK